MDIGRVGIWSSAWATIQRAGDPSGLDEAAAELDALGYGAIWLGASPAVAHAEPLLAATSRIVVATGILSIWEHPAAEVAAQRAALDRAYPGRFLLGLGVSHAQRAPAYARPYGAMRDYLTALDDADEPVPVSARVLAALGPKMLALSRDRAAGAHPYLVTAEHTMRARDILGADALLAPELKVVLDPDRDGAAAVARRYLASYLALPNYRDNLLRLGFSADDLRDGGSDRLVDAVFALGDADVVAGRVGEFLAAGADHVAVQVVTDDARTVLPRSAWRRLARTLPVGG
jgi:probable F420-dependent oxidoreductase